MTDAGSAASAESIAAAVIALRAGKAVVYPTETVYGLGVDAMSDDALAGLLDIKGRDAAKGMSALVPSLEASAALVREVPEGAAVLASALWPGPLTLVLPASAAVPALLVGATGGVGLRCSTDPVASALCAAFGGPVTATSANVSGSPAATDCAEAQAQLGESVTCYLDGGPRNAGPASTVVEFLDGSAYLRREGAVPGSQLNSILESAGLGPLEI